MITFESQEKFEEAVMDVLHSRLDIKIEVSTEMSRDYYSLERVPKVEVSLVDSETHETVCSAEDMAC